MMRIDGEVVGLKTGKTGKGDEYVRISILNRASDGTAGIKIINDYNGRSRGVKVGDMVSIEFWDTAYIIGKDTKSPQAVVKLVGVMLHDSGSASGKSLRAAV